ncbi:hypothetical protein LZ198_29900 [Myxococcus sp. K15C18031901]|uniref:hypothetical protein n=1 Tax=Myxococcus dinghuensis TaxID=2906761 RepID=UPI0020A71C6A|nr:hypothetical protein [Myxococcus dinghuensis]MCP3103100.1 hypothetical protein [Myxococcus dinghuensis]
MRSVIFATWVLAFLTVGCAAHRGDLDYPDREAVYDRPLEEVWPEVRGYFARSNLPFREDKGSMVLETEWRQEFGASKVSGFFHRYMVVGRREAPGKGKLQIFRITKNANKALSQPGKEIDWGVSRALSGAASPDGSMLSVEDDEDRLAFPRGENGFYMESGQGQRDLVMEWRVFREVAPRLAKEENAPKPVQVARLAQTRANPTQMSIECGLPIIGLGKQVKPGATMLLGEMHGTQEVPRFIAQLACQAAVAGTPVTVGLELPLENQARVDTFIDSAGAEEDWLKLMDAPFWRSPFPDGRGSEAVAKMLEQLRQLRSEGLDVDVFVFDHPKANGQQREDAMASTVALQVDNSSNRFHVVLSGNIHSRSRKGLPWDKNFRPMGLLLREKLGKVTSLDMAYDSGTAWICAVDSKGVKDRLDCGVRDAKGKDNGDRFFVHTWDGLNADGYHGVFYVGPVNASAPAVRYGEGPPGGNDNSSHPASGQGSRLAFVE